MRRDFLLCLALAIPVSAPGQAPDAPRLSGNLVIGGSSTMAPMIADMAARFRTIHPAVGITVEVRGSGRGISDAAEGKVDIGMASRDLHAGEKALFAIAIARDGVAFVAHKDNPVRGLTREQAVRVFAGEVRDWKALGGRSRPIEVVTRTPGRGVMEVVPQYLGIAPEAIRAEHAIGDNADLVRFIAGRPGAIAFLSISAADAAVANGANLKTLALDGRVPSSGAVRDGTWPMARTLNLVTRQVPTGLAKAFIEFALSPAAQSTIRAHDFVPY